MAGGVPAGRLSIEIVAEIARLQQDLDKAKRAVNAASKDIAASAKYANDNLATMGTGIKNVGVSSKQAAFGMRNLAFQAQDLGVQFAMAANSSDPLKGVLMALVMQGPQIKDAMNQAGLSVGGLGKLVGGMAVRWAPAALAIGGATAALSIFTEEVDKTAKHNVTMGDVVLGTFDAIVDYLDKKFGPAWKWISEVAGEAWEWIATAAKKSVNIVIGATSVIPKVLEATLKLIPAAFGDAFYSAANLAIKGINWLIEKASGAVNGLVDTFNAVFGTSIQKVVIGSIGEIANPYAGGMAKLGSAGAKAFTGAFERDYVGEFAKFVSPFADKRAAERLKKDGKDAGGKAGKAAGKEFVDEFMKYLTEQLPKDVGSAFQKIEADTKKIIDEIMKSGSKELEDIVEQINKGRQNTWDEDQRKIEENRNRALDTAYEIADIVGGRIGDAIGDMADALDKFDKLTGGDTMNKLGEKLGITGLSDAIKQMGAGAKFGGAVDSVFDAIGIKSSKTGAQIGGAIGQFAGPLGMIAGSILGGIVGGMMKSTPRASATVSFIAGEAMDVAIKGSSGKLKKIAGEMADGLIAGLEDIAKSLGGELTGDGSVSVGMRNGKYRVDASGQGITKTSKGAVDFGDDKASAIAFALQDAIKDGVLGGLTESLKKLITGDGDLQAQLQKALDFKSVFDTLAERDDPAKWAQDQVTKWHDGMAKIFAEAGATADELAELERLTGIKRADAAKEAADKIAQAQREALEQENALSSMRVTLLELQGKSAEALALSRQIELSTMTEAEKVIQRQIHAEQDLAKVRDETAAASEAAAAKWQTNYQIALGLTGRLLELDGDMEALRARELQQIPEHLRYLQKLIWAREDEAKATEAATKAAEELAAKHKAIADERYGLETQWLQAIGNEAELRKRALALLDPSNRAMQQQIWAYEDAQKAAQAEIEARNQQIASIRDTIDALSGAQAKWMEFAANIREFRAGLFSTENGSGMTLAKVRSEFDRTAKMARLGDEGALQSFTGVSKTFLDAARSNAGSLVDYQRAIGLVAGAADAAAAGADGVARQAADQYGAMLSQISQLEALNAQTEANVAIVAGMQDVQENSVAPTLKSVVNELQLAADKSAQDRAEEKAEALAIIGNLSEQNSILRQLVEAGNLRVVVMNDEGEPVRTLEVTP